MRDIFSVLRDYRLFGNDDEGGSGGGGSDKTYNSLSEAARDGQHGKAVNIKGKGRQKVEFADKSYNQRMATVSANAGGGGGGTVAKAAKAVSEFGGRGPDGRYEPIPGPRTIAQRIRGSFDGTDSFHRPASNFKTINNSQRQALEAAGYSVTKQGTVKSRDGSATVAGSRWSRSPQVNQIMAENADDRASVRSGGGDRVPVKQPVVPKKIVRPQLRPADLTAPKPAPPLDYDTLYTGDPGIFTSPYQVGPRPSTYSPSSFPGGGDPMYAPRTAPSAPSSFNLDRALSTPFNVDDNIYMTEAENQLLRDRAERQGVGVIDDVSAEERRTLAAQPISDLGLDGSVSVLGPDYPPSTDAALFGNTAGFAGQGNFPAYTTSFDDQSAAESFGDRQRRRKLAGDPTAFTGFNYPVASLDDPPPVIDTIPDLGSDPSDNREPRGMYDSPSIVLPDELIGAPMGYVPEPMTYQEILEGAGAEIIPEARTAPLSDYDADRLKPGFSQPLQARIDTPEEDAIERARLQARVGAGIGNISPEVERNAASNVRLQNLRRYVNQQRDPEPPGLSIAELVAAGLAQGTGTTAEGVGSMVNVIAPPDMLDDGADFVGPFRPGMEPKAGVPMVVGQQSKVATEAAIAAEGASNVFNRVIRNMDEKTRDAVTREIFPDGIGSFDSEAAKAQFVMQGASMFPVAVGLLINPAVGMGIGGGMTVADVGRQVDANIDARYNAGELGQLNPSQLQALKLRAREKVAAPSFGVGSVTAGLLGKNPVSGSIMEGVNEVLIEAGLAEVGAAIETGTDINPERLVAERPMDAAFLATSGGAFVTPAGTLRSAIDTATAPPPVVQTEAPIQDSLAYKAGQGIGNFTPPKAFSDAATLTATTMGGTPKMPSAVAPDAAAKVISGSGSNVAPAPVVGTKAPVQTLPENLGLPSLLNTAASNKVVQMTSPTALSANNQAQYTTPSFVPDGTAQLQAETVKKTGEGKAAPDIIDTVAEGTVDAPTPLTPEQIANVSPEAAVELDAALDVAPTIAVDAAQTQIDKNGLSRPENVSAAIDVMKRDGKNSASYLQRKLKINYSEAEAINEQLEAEGYVSAKNKFGARKILTTEPTPTPENRALQILQKARVQQNKGSNQLISNTDAKYLEAAGLLGPGASQISIAANASVADLLAQGPEAVKAKLKEKTKTKLDALTDQQLIDTVGGKPKSVGAAAGRSGVTDAILRKNPNYLPFGFDFNLGSDLETTLQDIAFQQAQENREAGRSNLGATPPDTIGRVPKRETQSELLLGDMGSTRQYSIRDADGNIRDDFVPSRFAPTAKGQYTGEQIAAQMNRERLARQERGETEAAGKAAGVEAIEASDAALLSGLPVDPAGIGSLRNFPSKIPLVDSPAAQADRRRAIANRLKGEAEAEAMAPLNRAQAALDAVVDPVPAAIQSVEAQRAEMLAANKTYQDYINTRAQISALDGVTKEQAEREAFAAVEQRIIDQQQRLLNAVNAEGGTAAITNAANNEIAKLEAQLNAVKEVIVNERTPRPVNFPPAPYKTTGETLMEKAAITTPVEVAEMSSLVPPASPTVSGEADITPPTLAEFIEIQRAKPRDGVPVDPLAAPVEMPPSQQEQLALDLQGGSAVTTPEGIMSLVVDRTSKAPAAMNAVNPVASPEISFEEAMATVAEAPTVRAPKDAGPLVLTEPVTQSGIASAVPGRIPKDKLPTRFDSNLPVDSPFSRENQLARYAERRARFAAQENELAAAQGLTPASKPVVSTKDPILKATEEISKENQIEQDRRNARNAALTGIASVPRAPITIMDEPRDLIEEQTLPDELLTEPFNNTPPEDTGGEGTGTPRESAPKYVPVDMNNENNDDLGCPSGYARVFDPATGQPICGRIDEPSAPGPAAPAEEAEEEEDGVVIDIPITERPKISPYYVPEMVESNYTPYVPGRRARTQ